MNARCGFHHDQRACRWSFERLLGRWIVRTAVWVWSLVLVCTDASLERERHGSTGGGWEGSVVLWLEMSGWSTNTRAIQQSIAMPQRNRSSHVQGRAPVCDYTPRCSRHPWRHDFPLQKTTCPNAPTSVFMSRSWSLWIFFNCVRSKCSLREHSRVQSSNRPDRERHHAKPSESPG